MLLPELAELKARLTDAMTEVGRLEREKASWMELYSQSETELAVMVARNAEEAAVNVATDAEDYVAKVQASFLTAALRRHAKDTLVSTGHISFSRGVSTHGPRCPSRALQPLTPRCHAAGGGLRRLGRRCVGTGGPGWADHP